MAKTNWVQLGVVGVGVFGLYQGSKGQLPVSLQKFYDKYIGQTGSSTAPPAGAPVPPGGKSPIVAPAPPAGCTNAFIPGVQYVAQNSSGGYDVVLRGGVYGTYALQSTAEAIYNSMVCAGAAS